jgi:hypothetical protein
MRPPPHVPGRGSAPPKRRTLHDLRPLVRAGQYRLGPHAQRHAATEGFTELDVVATVLHGRELMRYLHDQRLLVLGWVPVSASVRIPLHVVLEYRKQRWVDVVTAFIPSEPHRAVSRTRLAELLRHDGDEPRVTEVGPGAARRSVAAERRVPAAQRRPAAGAQDDGKA